MHTFAPKDLRYNARMSVKDLEQAVVELSPTELAAFTAWFEAYQAQAWDDRIEQDALSGKLDKLADAALESFKRGEFKQL
jgi:hypothetical protein